MSVLECRRQVGLGVNFVWNVLAKCERFSCLNFRVLFTTLLAVTRLVNAGCLEMHGYAFK